MTITVSELKNNLGKYIDLTSEEDIIVTKNGKERIKITKVNTRPLAFIDSVFKDAIIDEDIKDMKWERLKNV